MRKLLSALIIAAVALAGMNAFADMQYQNNGTNIGIVTKANIKGCTATRSGQLVLIDCTAVTGPITISGNVTVTGTTVHTGAVTQNGAVTFNAGIAGINWQSIPQGFTTGINWTGADILGRGLNWTDVRAFGTSNGGDHSGINWQSFGV